MKIVCMFCQEVVGEKEGKGSTATVCDECQDWAASGQNTDGISTTGKCAACNIRFTWSAPVRLRNPRCPYCHGPLKRTSHLFQGKTVAVRRPPVQYRPRGIHVVRIPQGVRS